ncbi:MAG: CsgG/HfaB family protein [bacterium]
MRKVFGLVCAVLFFFVGCGTVSYIIPIMQPAEVNLKNFKKIAIGDITGTGAENFTDELTQALFNCDRFEVLDRQNLDRIMKEHHFDLAGVVDETTAAQIGKFIGAAALVFGRVSLYKYGEEVVYSDSKDYKTGIVTRYYYRIGEANVTANLRVTDLTTGKILAVKNIAEKSTVKSSASKGTPEDIDKDGLLAKTREAVVNRFMKMIAPYQVNLKVQFLVDNKMPELGRGINVAKAGELKEAADAFKEVIKKYAGTSEFKIDKAHYNLGLTLVLMNEYKEGIEELKKAIKINPNQKLYQDYVSWSKKREKEYKKLLQQQ